MQSKTTDKLVKANHSLVGAKRWSASTCCWVMPVFTFRLFQQRQPLTLRIHYAYNSHLFESIRVHRWRFFRSYSPLSIKSKMLGYVEPISLLRSFIIQHDGHACSLFRHYVRAGLTGIYRKMKLAASIRSCLSNRGPNSGLLAFSRVPDHDSLSIFLFKQNINPQIGGIA